MNIHTLQPETKLKSRKRIGRGGKKGTYSGKGMKGQKARSGAKLSPLFAGGAPSLMGQGSQIIHKLRGQGNSPHTNRSDVKIINIRDVDVKFDSGEIVSPETLIERGLIKGKSKIIKILGKGETTKKFIFEGVHLSSSVKIKYTSSSK